MRQIVQHNGEQYIFETTETPGGNVYRAAVLHEIELGDWMRDYLDNQDVEAAYADGEWLATELAWRARARLIDEALAEFEAERAQGRR